MRPLLSIITVVRDNLDGLAETAASLRQQGCRDFEWIVVDGDSCDGTKAWLLRHRNEVAWWRSAPDRGIYHAMNLGVERARGRFALFLNGGDRLADSGVVARLAAAVARDPDADFLYGDSLEQLPDGRVAAKRARSHKLASFGMFTHHQAMLFRICPGCDVRYKEAYPIGADYAATICVLMVALKVVRLSCFISLVAVPGVSARNTAQGRLDQHEIRRKILGLGKITCILVRLIQWASQLMRDQCSPVYYSLRFGIRPLPSRLACKIPKKQETIATVRKIITIRNELGEPSDSFGTSAWDIHVRKLI
jgi:putative colanic acid biosynthesis glycosyltransferase